MKSVRFWRASRVLSLAILAALLAMLVVALNLPAIWAGLNLAVVALAGLIVYTFVAFMAIDRRRLRHQTFGQPIVLPGAKLVALRVRRVASHDRPSRSAGDRLAA